MSLATTHSVMLDKDKCKGCTTCIKHCPTEAIRVRAGKATILPERCIDCGQCIRVCPHRAKRAVCTPLDALKNKKYNVALPAPSFYGQFNHLTDVGYVLTGLTKIGFDDVFEVASAAEIISAITRQYIKDENTVFPLISSACPACVRLIKMRFPNLIQNVVKHAAPVELAAMLAREKAMKDTGLSADDIGVYFITPCPAKMTATLEPVGFKTSALDGAFAMNEIYTPLVGAMNNLDEPTISPSSGLIGIGWSVTGGESSALLVNDYIAVDGIDNVIKILEDIEDDKLTGVKFIELNACVQGCVGGCLTVENPYVAKAKVRGLMKYLPVSRSKELINEGMDKLVHWERELEYTPVWELDADMSIAFERMQEIQRLVDELPGLDCGSCGAPSCKALAEDIALGFASEDDCIFKLREKMLSITDNDVQEADAYLPPPFRKEKRVKGSEIVKNTDKTED